MADVFLSYSSKDRAAAERVQIALTAKNIDVFWDQETPPGQDWDTWIRTKLSTCRVAVVLWSRASVKSENVRHEAIVARKAGKFLPACVEPLEPEDFPMGLYIVQAVNLTDWRSESSKGIARLVAEIEVRLGRALSAAMSPSRAAAQPTTNAGALVGGLAALALAAFGIWYFLLRDDHPVAAPTSIETVTGEAMPAPTAECLDGSRPTNGVCVNGNRPIPPAPVLGAGSGRRGNAGAETFADKIGGYWNWSGVACAAGPHVTLENGKLVFTTPDGRFVHAILQQTSQETMTKVIEPPSEAGEQYRLTPEYFATDALRSFNLVVQNTTTGTRDTWAPCEP